MSAAGAAPVQPKSASVFRQSYTQPTGNFGTLIQLIVAIPGYTPKEEELKIPNLKQYQDSLVEATASVDVAEGQLNNRLIECDRILYPDQSGLYSIALNVKKIHKKRIWRHRPGIYRRLQYCIHQ